MTEPLRTRYAPGYDLFKLIVAILLTIALIWLLLQENRRKYEQIEILPIIASTPTLAVASPVEETPTPEITETADVATSTPEPTQIAEPAPTESPAPVAPSPSPSPKAGPSPEADTCPSNPTQVEVGDMVIVLDWLNFRTGPGLNFPIQHTNRPGTEMEVIGGPVCTIKDEDPPRAYLWWNMRMNDGREGWSAEAPLNFPNYFMEPVQ